VGPVEGPQQCNLHLKSQYMQQGVNIKEGFGLGTLGSNPYHTQLCCYPLPGAWDCARWATPLACRSAEHIVDSLLTQPKSYGL
jgi:hypothetical protein